MTKEKLIEIGVVDAERDGSGDISLTKVKKLMKTRPVNREKGTPYILLSIPMELEFKALLDKLEVPFRRRVIEGIPGITFTAKAGEVFAFISKVGRTNTAFDLGLISQRLNVKKIINMGTAGSLAESVNSLDVVIATSVAYYDVDLTAFDYEYGQMSGCPPYFKTDSQLLMSFDSLETSIPIHKGLILTADSFITKENLNLEILKHFDHPLALDMEGAAVGQVAERLAVPFIIIRCISDNIEGENNRVVHEEFATLSARRAATIALHLLSQETRF